MDVGSVQTIISNLGFPIACVIAMFWMMNKEREDHKEELQKVTEALSNNTLALTELQDMLRK
jgi:large-conductance mechanosensitive channel